MRRHCEPGFRDEPDDPFPKKPGPVGRQILRMEFNCHWGKCVTLESTEAVGTPEERLQNHQKWG